MASSVSCGFAFYLDGATYNAQLARCQHVSATFFNNGAGQVAGGILPAGGAMQVTAPGSGMSANVASGYAVCPSSTGSTYGGYLFGLMSAANLSVATSDPTNPRIDMVAAYVNDLGTSGSAAYVEVLTGTPTAGATLANLNGAPAAPPNSVIIAYILIPASSTSVTSGNIADARSWTTAQGGIVPVSSIGAAPGGYPGNYIHDRSTGRLVHNNNTGAVQPVLLPVAPQLTTAAGGSYTGGANLTVCSLSVTCDGMTDLEILCSWEGFQVYNSAATATWQLLIDSTVVRTFRTENQSVTGATRGGGSFTHITSSGVDRPAAGTHTVSIQYQDNVSTGAHPGGPVATEMYVRAAPL